MSNQHDIDIEKWKAWLGQIPTEEVDLLAEALSSSYSGLRSAPAESQISVRVEREPVEGLIYPRTPTFVDVFGLYAVFKNIAFKSNLLLKGPKGDGKSLSVIAYSSTINCPVVIQECSEDTKKYELHGTQSLLGDETVFVLGSIPTAIDVANEVGQCILLFEELNALTPQVQKQLNAVTDFRKMASLRQIGRTYQLREHARLWVVGTMNPSVYGGTYDLNEDLKSRFEEIEVTYPNFGQEKRILAAVCPNMVPEAQLDQLIKLAHETRQSATGYALSTRDLVRLVQTVRDVGLEIALQMVVCKFEGDDDRNTVITRIGSIFGQRNLRKYWGAS